MPARPLVCAYCGGAAKARRELTKEHFVPQGLWDGPRPNRTITVPVHKRCNGGFAQDDEYLRTVLVSMAFDGGHPEIARLLAGAMARGFAERPRLLADHLRNLAVRPLVRPTGLYVGHAPTFVLDERRLALSLSRVVRGLYFATYRRPLPHGYGIVVQVPAPSLAEMADMTATMSAPRDFGDDVFKYLSVRETTDENATCWLLVFYRTVYFFGWTLPRDHEVGRWADFIRWTPGG